MAWTAVLKGVEKTGSRPPYDKIKVEVTFSDGTDSYDKEYIVAAREVADESEVKVLIEDELFTLNKVDTLKAAVELQTYASKEKPKVIEAA